jgi:hypothetical protein
MELNYFTSVNLEEVKNRLKGIKNPLLFLRIISELEKENYEAAIARKLGIKKQLCHYYIKKAEELKIVRKSYRTSIAIYEVLPIWKEVKKVIIESVKSKNLSLQVKSVRTHNLAIKFPILHDNPGAIFDKEIPVNGWIKKFDIVTFPVRITIEKTPKHIILHFHEFSVTPSDFLTYTFRHVLKGILFAQEHLKRKGIVIDILEGEVIREHIANELPGLNSMIPKNRSIEIRLDREAKSIYPFNEKSMIWIDRSRGSVEIETNDLSYEENILLFFERATVAFRKIDQILHLLQRNLSRSSDVNTADTQENKLPRNEDLSQNKPAF